MYLDSNKKLSVVLAGAKTTLDAIWIVNYEDVPVSGNVQGLTPAALPGSFTGTTNGATAVDMAPAPSAGFIRKIISIQFNNADTGSITAAFTVTDSGTARNVFKGTRATLEQLNYSITNGWQAYSVAMARQ